jgi:hypothetical protein
MEFKGLVIILLVVWFVTILLAAYAGYRLGDRLKRKAIQAKDAALARAEAELAELKKRAQDAAGRL